MSDDKTDAGAGAGVGGESFDQTNGMVEGLHGDDDGVVDPEDDGSGGVLGSAFRRLTDPDGTGEGSALSADDRDEAKTSYSEEGKP